MTSHPNRSTGKRPPLARALKAWREREGLSLRGAAERFDVPPSTWVDAERGDRETHMAGVAGALLLDEMAKD